ncbi:helix-turn-helix domain-containing protein [Herpetosiphon gulosus]|uniref:HTH arsR-type domain-containing protein n=1 Tax=Herpetosiphon gulosus TaxID=1973496 RepID=A0ABP9WYS8_9CHLR
MNTNQIARIFEAMASPIRLEIYRLLVTAEPAGKVAGQIASQLEIPPSNLSFHLKALVAVDLLIVAQEGRFLRYRANLSLMDSVIWYLTSECCQGVPERCGRCAAPLLPITLVQAQPIDDPPEG